MKRADIRTQLIAEVSSNHGGNIKIAKQFIRVAADLGIDYIKFQSWQLKNIKLSDPQYEWFKKAELSDEQHYELIDECKKRGIKFLTTCFDMDRIKFLASLGLTEIKISSSDCASLKMLKEISRNFKHLIISTGMHYKNEVIKAAHLLKNKEFTFLHCVSLYPTPHDKVNLKRMDWLRNFTDSVGYSDHCVGIEAVKLAIARGASYVEKHFTLGKGSCPRTMIWDATPEDFRDIIAFKEKCEMLLGDMDYSLSPEEIKMRNKSIGRLGNNR